MTGHGYKRAECISEVGKKRKGRRKSDEDSPSDGITCSPFSFFRQSEGEEDEGDGERPLNRGPRNWLIGAPVIALMRQAAASKIILARKCNEGRSKLLNG